MFSPEVSFEGVSTGTFVEPTFWQASKVQSMFALRNDLYSVTVGHIKNKLRSDNCTTNVSRTGSSDSAAGCQIRKPSSRLWLWPHCKEVLLRILRSPFGFLLLRLGVLRLSGRQSTIAARGKEKMLR